MTKFKFLNSIGDPIVSALMRSPFHGFLSENVILITYVGRKSGKEISVPVNYQQEGRLLRIISQRDRVWWRNMRDGATVKVLIKGQKKDGWAELIEEDSKVAEEIKKCLKQDPQYAKYLNVRLGESGEINGKELTKMAKSRVVVLIKLSK